MKKKIGKAVFPAAGLGTRFLPATKASPKEMLPIVDKPMIQYAVEEAERFGIKEMLIITSKYKKAIEDHFDSEWELEENLRKKGKQALLEEIKQLDHLQVAYIRQKVPLGLGHAILCSRPFVKNEAFAVILSDDIIEPEETLLGDMIARFEEHQSTILALQKVPRSEIHRYGVIAGKEIRKNLYEIHDLIEKPKPSSAPSDLAILGRYILTPEIFPCIEKTPAGKGGEMQLTDALKALLKKGPIYGVLFNGKRYDGGDKVGYLKATVEFALKHQGVNSDFKKYLLNRTKKLHK